VSLSVFPSGGPRLKPEEFRLIRELVNRFCGILLSDTATLKVERRLGERLGALGMKAFSDYYRHLLYHPERKQELEHAIDLLTTNETYFFRERAQLTAFRDEVLPILRDIGQARRNLTIWSAGCSTGEEVYTLAILIKESGLFPDWDIQIFGNDISRRVLHVARRAVYGESSFRNLPDEYRDYFIETSAGRAVIPSVRSMCHFGHFNLLDEPRAAMVGQVDAILCRNVLIYFDQASRMKLIQMFFRRLRPGGFLMLGHSESLLSVSTAFELAHLRGDLAYRKPLNYFSSRPEGGTR
jgi:chemotaxis protein methyltransferase CheR